MTSPQDTRSSRPLSRRDKAVAMACGLCVAGMVGAAYAAVPFYNWFCRVTGFNGTTQISAAAPGTVLDQINQKLGALRQKGIYGMKDSRDMTPKQLKLNRRFRQLNSLENALIVWLAGKKDSANNISKRGLRIASRDLKSEAKHN